MQWKPRWLGLFKICGLFLVSSPVSTKLGGSRLLCFLVPSHISPKTRGVLLPCLREFRPLIRRIRVPCPVRGTSVRCFGKTGGFPCPVWGTLHRGPSSFLQVIKVARQFRQESRRSVATIWCYCKAITRNLFVSRPMFLFFSYPFCRSSDTGEEIQVVESFGLIHKTHNQKKKK